MSPSAFGTSARPIVWVRSPSGTSGLGLEQRHRLPDQGRRVVERSDQRQLFVVDAPRVQGHGGTRGAAAKEYHGPSPADSSHGLLPDLRPARRVHGHVHAGAARRRRAERAARSATGRVQALGDAEAPDPVESPARACRRGAAARPAAPPRGRGDSRAARGRSPPPSCPRSTRPRSMPRSAQARGSAKAARRAGNDGPSRTTLVATSRGGSAMYSP